MVQEDRLSQLIAQSRGRPSRLADEDEDEESALSRALNLLLTAEPIFETGQTLAQRFSAGANRLLPGDPVPSPDFDYNDINPAVRFVADTLLSPVGLASLIAAPVTGGTSIAARLGAGAGVAGARAGAIRAGSRLVPELAVSAAAGGAARGASELIPEDAPGALQIGVPLLAGLAGAGGATTALRRSLAETAKVSAGSARITQSRVAMGNKYVSDTVPFKQVYDEVGLDTKWTADLLAAGRIDRSANLTDPVERTGVALARVNDLIPYQANAQWAAVFPEGGFRKAVPTDALGNVVGLKDKTNVLDLLSHKETPTTLGLSDLQVNALRTTKQVWKEVQNLLEFHGIKLPTMEFKDGMEHFPRLATSQRGIKFRSPSNMFEQRFWGDVDDAVAKGEMVYGDVDQTMTHAMRTAMQMIAEKQALDNAVQAGVTLAVASKATKEGNIINKQQNKATRKANQLRNAIQSERAAGRATTKLEQRLANWEAKKAQADAEWESLKQKDQNSLPGSLFGAGEAAVSVTKWRDRWFPTEQIHKLDEWVDRGHAGRADRVRYPTIGKGTRRVQEAGNLMRFTAATADVGAAFIQGLPLLAHDPIAWSKVAYNSITSLFNPEWQTQYMAKHLDDVLDMVQNGRVPLSDIEMFKALEAGGAAEALLRHAPSKVGGAVRRFQTSYNTALLVERVEFWKLLRPTWQGSSEELGAFIRNATGGLESATLGIGPNQRAAESILFFAPKLLRSTLAHFAAAARPDTPQGREAAVNLLRFSGAMAGLFAMANIGIGLRQGEDAKQLEERVLGTLNPLNGRQFLGVKVGDAWYGAGSSVRSTLQFVTRAITDPASLLTEGALDNPFVSYLQGRSSPLSSLALGGIELATEEKHNLLPFEYVDSIPTLAALTAKGLLPFSIQGLTEAADIQREDLNDPGTVLSKLARGFKVGSVEFFGARTSPVTPYDIFRDEAHKRYGRDWADLTDLERDAIRKDMPEVEKKRNDYDGRAERELRQSTDENDEQARQTMLAAYSQVKTGGMSREQLRESIQTARHDRFVQNQELRENLEIDFGEPDTVRELVLDAYFQTFEDAQLSPGSTQIDFNRWQELQAELDKRVAAGEFGPAGDARKQLDERRKFEMPEELRWFDKNEDYIRDSGYWEIKEEIFTQRYVGMSGFGSVNELESAINQAGEQGDPNFGRLRRILNRLNADTTKARQQLRRKDKGLDGALKENGYIDIPLR